MHSYFLLSRWIHYLRKNLYTWFLEMRVGNCCKECTHCGRSLSSMRALADLLNAHAEHKVGIHGDSMHCGVQEACCTRRIAAPRCIRHMVPLIQFQRTCTPPLRHCSVGGAARSSVAHESSARHSGGTNGWTPALTFFHVLSWVTCQLLFGCTVCCGLRLLIHATRGPRPIRGPSAAPGWSRSEWNSLHGVALSYKSRCAQYHRISTRPW